MNTFHKCLYIIACDMLAFFIWNIYDYVFYHSLFWLPVLCLFLSIIISIYQIKMFGNKLEIIPVRIDEMNLRGVDASNAMMTGISYLFIFSFLISKDSQGIKTDSIIISSSILVQFIFSILTDNLPYDFLYLLRGFAYRQVKIDGIEQLLLCRKKIRNKTSIQQVTIPFRGLLVNIEHR